MTYTNAAGQPVAIASARVICNTCGQPCSGLQWHCRECDTHVSVAHDLCPDCEEGFSPMFEREARRELRAVAFRRAS